MDGEDADSDTCSGADSATIGTSGAHTCTVSVCGTVSKYEGETAQHPVFLLHFRRA